MNAFEEKYPGTEREWDSFTFIRTDFRTRWNGDGISMLSLIRPQDSVIETAEFAQQCVRKISGWILDNREKFGANDRFEIVIGWPLSIRKTRRQIVKIGGTFQDIEDLFSGKRLVELRTSWSEGIFP